MHSQDHIVGIDQFGRLVEQSHGDNGKQVGMFFWAWLGQPFLSGFWDAQKISELPDGNNILYYQDNKELSPSGQGHWWGEPLWGYYNSMDEWVIRKQLEMLTTAGVDYIAFDTTNNVTYNKVYWPVMKVITEMVEQGFNPPRVTFYTHTRSIKTVLRLYEDIYKPNVYPQSWYRLDGKPFIIAFTDPAADLAAEGITDHSVSTYHPEPYPKEIEDFFTFKRPQWPTNDVVYPDGLPWVEWIYPQPIHTDIMNVTVGSHPNVPMSFTITRGLENWGRGWDPVNKVNVAEDAEKGTFVQRQWDNAIAEADKLSMVFVGGWNEWIAYKQLWDGEYMLCDAATMELSRDIEPMKGGYEDAFYLQLIQNVRKFKSVGMKNTTAEDGVYYKVDASGMARDEYSCCEAVRYTQKAPANTLQKVEIVNDAETVTFTVTCKDDITPFAGDPAWMNLYLGMGMPAQKGWESYEYVLRAKNGSEMVLYTLAADKSVSEKLTVPYQVNGNCLTVTIPRSVICAYTLYFKVTDSVEGDGIMDTYTSGSAMPMGRLSYSYRLK